MSHEEKQEQLAKARLKVSGFYHGPYLKDYQQYNPNSDAILNYIPQQADGILLQDAFIANYGSATAEREKLLTSDIVPTYSTFHEKYHPVFLDFLQKHGFYDALLVDAESGDVVYSSLKEADFGQNVNNSALNQTTIIKVIEKAKKIESDDAVFQDFSLYTPSMGKPIALWASPVYLDKKLLGFLIIKVQTNLISNIITNNLSWKTDGLGETGEVLVTGTDGLLRNDSRYSFENPEGYLQSLVSDSEKKTVPLYLLTNSNAFLQENKTLAVEDGGIGKRSVADYTSLNGREVIGAYGPLRYGDLKWVISAEIEQTEAHRLFDQLNRYIWLVVLVIIVILIPLSYGGARLFLKPFNRLISTIDRIYKTHNLKLRLNGRFTIEINSLIDSFNRMLDRLQENEKVITAAKENIDDSITVANRVLISKLPPQAIFDDLFNKNALLWQPRDTVGGDVYWLRDFNNRIYMVCIDCTGHGVPGAFIALTVLASLEQVPSSSYKGYRLPELVHAISKSFQKQFSQTDGAEKFKDGFAMSILCFDKVAESISFIGMGQDGIVKHADGTVTLMKGNRKSIGYGATNFSDDLHSVKRAWDPTDTYLLYTDGLTTQVGESKRKMMGTSHLVRTTENIEGNDPEQVVAELLSAFRAWCGNAEIRDDVTLIAVKPKSLK